MDYTPLNVVSGRPAGAEANYITPVIGSYDYLAIKYGYMEVEGEQNGLPHPALVALADHDLPFGTDEDEASGQEPYVATYDLSSDPIRYHNNVFDLVADMRPNFLNRAALPGDPFMGYAAGQRELLSTAHKAAKALVTYIGGYDIGHAHRPTTGDVFPGPVNTISAEDQKRALAGILRFLTEDGPDDNARSIFPQPAEFPYILQKNDTMCDKFDNKCYRRTAFPLLDEVDANRAAVLQALLDVQRLNRLRQGEWYQKSAGENAFGVSDLLQGITNGLWGTNLARSARASNDVNWNILSLYKDMLDKLADGKTPAALRVPALSELRRLEASVKDAVKDEGAADQPSYPFLTSLFH